MAETFPAPPVRTPFWDPVNPKIISRAWLNWFQQLGVVVGDVMSGGNGSGGSASLSFEGITSGENVQATMKVGTGASIIPDGGGVIDATEINGIPITGMLTHPGQIPISQPGNASAIWSDPLVQGTQAAGTTASTINPVLVSGKGADGNQHDLSTDNSGNLNVINPGTFAVQDNGTATTSTAANTATIATEVATTNAILTEIMPANGNYQMVSEVPQSPMIDLLKRMFVELKGIRLAVVATACDGNRNKPQDFEPDEFISHGDDFLN